MVAAFFSLALLAPLPHAAQPAIESDPIEVSRAPDASVLGAEANASHDVAIEVVAPGREGLELSARLTDDGGLIERPISWTIRDMDGHVVFSGESPTADLSAPPGDYAVEIRYGAVRLSSTVTLLETSRVMVSYVLNAGGLRILPRLKDQGPVGVKSLTRIFALGGRDNGRLVAVNDIPGDILRLPEGEYRIESRFDAGNARAVTDVRVEAGRMSAVAIDHKAGLARLSFVGAPDAAVSWTVTSPDGNRVAGAEGLEAQVVLTPGTYTASARVGSESLTATFEIATGEARDIILGN